MIAGMLFSLAVATSTGLPKGPPDCSQWYKTMVWVNLKNEGLVDPPKVTDTSGQATLLASETVGPNQLRKYVYLVTFPSKAGGSVQAIATGRSSKTECSETGVNVYIVSKFIDGGP